MVIVIDDAALWSRQSQTDAAGLIMLEALETMTGTRLALATRLSYVRAVQQMLEIGGDGHWYPPGAFVQEVFDDLTWGLRTLPDDEVERFATVHQTHLMAMPALQPGVAEAMWRLSERGDTVVLIAFARESSWVEGVLIHHGLRLPTLDIRESPLDDRVLRTLRDCVGPDEPAYFITHRQKPYLRWAGKHGFTRIYFPQHPDEAAIGNLAAEHRIISLQELLPLLN